MSQHDIDIVRARYTECHNASSNISEDEEVWR